MELDLTGQQAQEAVRQLEALRENMTSRKAGMLSSWSLEGGEDVQQFVMRCHSILFPFNEIFVHQEPALGEVEDEVLDWCVNLMRGSEASRANFTLGGTESIFCALHAMREWGRDARGITEPEIIVPHTAHAASGRGSHYLGLREVRVPTTDDGHADVDAMEAAITPNTVGLYASAPCWPYGLVDPVEAIGALAEKNGLWLHVDACVGGYVLPFVERAGYPVPAWDFRVPGVRTISADLHKYGFAPKPCSTILWRNREDQQYHVVTHDDWPTGRYFTHSMLGSRPFAPIAAIWALIRTLGEEGYTGKARRMMEVGARIRDAVQEIDGLSWRETGTTLWLIDTSEEVEIGALVTALHRRGWRVLTTPAASAIHLTGDVVPEAWLEEFLEALAAAAADARAGRVEADARLGRYSGGTEGARWFHEAQELLERRSAGRPAP